MSKKLELEDAQKFVKIAMDVDSRCVHCASGAMQDAVEAWPDTDWSLAIVFVGHDDESLIEDTKVLLKAVEEAYEYLKEA
jgi:hypothetical protein